MDEQKSAADDALLDFESKSTDEIRALLDELYTEEQRVSYRRRVLHGKIDILKAELIRRMAAVGDDEVVDQIRGNVPRLVEILSKDLRGVSRVDVADDDSVEA